MKKKILLTGASGTVGKAVLKQLYDLKDRFDITVFDLKSFYSKKIFRPFKKEIHVVYGSLTREKDLIEVCKDKDVVIHLAAVIPPLADDNPKLAHQVNVEGTNNLIRLLEQHSPDAFFLYSSSVSVYGDRLKNPYISVGDPLQPSKGDEYGKTKIQGENSVKSSKLNWTIFRLCAIMGGHKLSKIMFHQPLKTAMEIASPEDTARAFVKAIDKQDQLTNKIFNLGGGEKCRVIYDNFLSKTFKIFGLGELNFSPKAFAEKNFHCGFYKDDDALENILHFRKNTLEDFYKNEEKKVSPFVKFITSIFRRPIKKYIEKKSDPLKAFDAQDKEMTDHFFKQRKEEVNN